MKVSDRSNPFVSWNLARRRGTLPIVSAMIQLSDPEWALIEDLFDPQGRRGVPAWYPRRLMVDAILFLARTGCHWRYLPDRYPPWEAGWRASSARSSATTSSPRW
jgi:transposase